MIKFYLFFKFILIFYPHLYKKLKKNISLLNKNKCTLRLVKVLIFPLSMVKT